MAGTRLHEASGAGPPFGVVLAGGAGRRIGGDKAVVQLAGRPLLHYPLAVLEMVLDEVAVVAKRDTVLPALPDDVPVWVEPAQPQHPLAGVAHALRCAGERPVLVCAVDLPLVTPGVMRELLLAEPGDAPVVVPRAAGRLEPLCALYLPQALAALAGFPPDARATDVVAGMGPAVVDVEDAEAFFNINAPEDVLQASTMIAARR
ncbi:MAG: molybdenum cofactor guanylyltransferase [Actinomycetota bacterium]|nr:molybdenum cofactor guanylyltransferase [Actinomycetota bacterium]